MGTASQSHYDVLGIGPRASRQQIEKAFRFLWDMYGEGALATYSLLDTDEIEAARRRIREAHEVLADPVRRREYDAAHGHALGEGPLLPFEPVPTETASPEPPSQPRPKSSPEVLPEPVTGADLRRVREERGVSLEEIAAVSKIGLRHLRYIEDDRHALLPATVYLRGFVQEYAKAVGLEPRQTARSYVDRFRG